MAETNPRLIADGDTGFNAVNDRLHPSLLPPGTLSRLVNGTLEFGDIRPRWGVQSAPWGSSGLVYPSQFSWNAGGTIGQNLAGDFWKVVSGFNIGATYRYSAGTTTDLTSMRFDLGGGDYYQSGESIEDGDEFVATQSTYYLWTSSNDSGNGNTATIALVSTKRALAAFNDPEGYQYLVATNTEARTGTGEDGGQGKALKIQSGSGIESIPLNGHDVWGDVRLVPVRGAMILLRHGNARWYWTDNGTNLDTVADTITLNNVSGLFTGDKVRVVYESGGINPIAGTEYWVTIVSSVNKTIYLCATRADALGATPINLTSVGTGTRLYLEKVEAYAQTSASGSYSGTNAVPLILQTAVTASTTVQSWVNGFTAARDAFTCKNTQLTTEWFCENHNFKPAMPIQFSAATGGFLTTTYYYANPLDADRFTLHASSSDALGGVNAIASSAASPTYSLELIPLNASDAPMPGGREGAESGGRLLIATGRDGIAISDAMDHVHFTPYTGGVTANLGESTPITAIVPMSEYSCLVSKSDSLFILDGVSGAVSERSLRTVSKEYGFIAPLTAILVGSDVWGLSRAGIVSARQTELGKTQGNAIPISQPMTRKIMEIDWQNAAQSCAAWFNNRYLCAVPCRGQTGTIKNNCIFVYNFLNQSWDGYWQGDSIDVVQFARHTVNGQQRLCFISSDGTVRYFDETALTDLSDSIEMEATTRGYSAGYVGPKLWNEIEMCFDSWYPEFSVDLIPEGAYETVSVKTGFSLDRTAFFTFNAGQRTPDSTAAHGEDYALITDDEDLVTGEGTILGVFQSVTKRMPIMKRDRVAQVRISTTRGNVKIKSIMMQGAMDRMLAAAQPN